MKLSPDNALFLMHYREKLHHTNCLYADSLLLASFTPCALMLTILDRLIFRALSNFLDPLRVQSSKYFSAVSSERLPVPLMYFLTLTRPFSLRISPELVINSTVQNCPVAAMDCAIFILETFWLFGDSARNSPMFQRLFQSYRLAHELIHYLKKNPDCTERHEKHKQEIENFIHDKLTWWTRKGHRCSIRWPWKIRSYSRLRAYLQRHREFGAF